MTSDSSAGPTVLAHEETLRAFAIACLRAGESLAGADLSGITLKGVDFGGPGTGPFSFEGALLRGALFESADLSGADFTGADLSGATFRNVNLTRACFDRCAARGALFTDVNLAYGTFAGSDLRGSIFFDANLADISFKGATLDGAEVEAIRLSLNGSTHVLGLKEALRQLAAEESYPLIAGVSGDAFWISYLLRTRDLYWGGFAREVLRRGLENFGFPCSFVDEVEEEAAWGALMGALSEGGSVITPLHGTTTTVLGSGLGGAEWVYVSGIDRGELLVHSFLGDAMRFDGARFRAGWCQHHPGEESAEDLPVIYALCVVRPRQRVPARREIIREGLRGAVEILTLPSDDRLVFGFDAYAQMGQDLDAHLGPEALEPDEARRFLPWLGLGLLHHHGSRWAIRDFLADELARGEFTGRERLAVEEAHELYAGACSDLQRMLRLLPWSFDLADERARDEGIRRYHEHREESSDLLRAAAARERDAVERFRALCEPS